LVAPFPSPRHLSSRDRASHLSSVKTTSKTTNQPQLHSSLLHTLPSNCPPISPNRTSLPLIFSKPSCQLARPFFSPLNHLSFYHHPLRRTSRCTHLYRPSSQASHTHSPARRRGCAPRATTSNYRRRLATSQRWPPARSVRRRTPRYTRRAPTHTSPPVASCGSRCAPVAGTPFSFGVAAVCVRAPCFVSPLPPAFCRFVLRPPARSRANARSRTQTRPRSTRRGLLHRRERRRCRRRRRRRGRLLCGLGSVACVAPPAFAAVARARRRQRRYGRRAL
jgi:hypothetical protein